MCKRCKDTNEESWNRYGPATVRHASATKAAKMGVNIDEIKVFGDWKSQKVVEMYYLKEIKSRNDISSVIWKKSNNSE